MAQLPAENATLKMEREILKKATAFFAKETQVKFAFVATERTGYPIRRCAGCSKSRARGFSAGGVGRTDGVDPDAALRADLQELHRGSRQPTAAGASPARCAPAVDG